MPDFDDRDSFEEPAPRLSTLAKVLLAIAVLSGLSMLLCCGGVFWFARNAIQIADQPQEIQRIREQLMRIEIPDQYQPRGAVSVNLWLRMEMVAYTRGDEQNDGGVMLMQISAPGQQTQDELRQAFEKHRREQGQDQKIDIENRETRSFTIDGREVEFEFLTGTNPDTGKAVRHVTGLFPGRNGTAFFFLFEDAEHWNEEQVVEMIQSISAQ